MLKPTWVFSRSAFASPLYACTQGTTMLWCLGLKSLLLTLPKLSLIKSVNLRNCSLNGESIKANFIENEYDVPLHDTKVTGQLGCFRQ